VISDRFAQLSSRAYLATEMREERGLGLRSCDILRDLPLLAAGEVSTYLYFAQPLPYHAAEILLDLKFLQSAANNISQYQTIMRSFLPPRCYVQYTLM
jgi:hypothetical protein